MVDYPAASAEQAARQVAADDRKVLNGIYWRLRTGSPWDNIPERYGPATTCANRFGAGPRSASGTASSRPCRPPMTATCNDRLVLRSGASAWRQRQKGVRHATPATARDHARAQCMGRSRGGLTTKIDALVDTMGLPIALTLSEGQAHDGRSAASMLGALGPGQSSSPIAPTTATRPPRHHRARSLGQHQAARPPRRQAAFSPFLYRYRNRVERFFNKLKHFRAVATRYEKHASNYLALIKLAATHIWLSCTVGDLSCGSLAQ